MMEEISTILIRDADSSDEAVVIVRHDTKHVALSISLRSDGDVELVMENADAKAIMEALRVATGSCP